MKTTILVVGKLKDRYLKEGIEDYLKRTQRYSPVELLRVKEEPKPDAASEARGKAREAERLLAQIRPTDTVVAMTEEGRRFSSQQWSSTMMEMLEDSRGRLVFVIGSGAGLAPEVKQRANLLLSLSPMTFPHQVALLLLMEQLYRAWTIAKREPYHR